VTVELDVRGLSPRELRWAASLADFLVTGWPEGHQPTRRLFAQLSEALDAHRVELEHTAGVADLDDLDHPLALWARGLGGEPPEPGSGPILLDWSEDMDPGLPDT
jgi:hypothetical protein